MPGKRARRMVETSLALSPTSDTSLMPLQRMNKNQTLLYASEPGMFSFFSTIPRNRLTFGLFYVD